MNWLSDRLLHRLAAAAEAPDLSATKYRLLEKLSAGGMGAIYLAEDRQLHRTVALKVMHLADDTGSEAARMLREARVIAQLEHPGIVPVHDVGTLPDGRVFYVMKLVQGRRLDQYAAENGALPERLRVFQKICEAVAFAHANGVIHRDLKPANVMVGAFGEVLVMDWGLAKIMGADSLPVGGKIEDRGLKIESLRLKSEMEEDGDAGFADRKLQNTGREDLAHGNVTPAATTEPHTAHGTVMGTPAYMAPEQEQGEIEQIDQRSDVYALGAILRFLLYAASHMHPGPAAANGMALPTSASLPSPARAKVPKYLSAICAKAMAHEKEQRYASALDLAADIERFLNGLAVSSYRENLFETLWRRLKKYQLIILLVLAYVLVRLALILWLRP